MAELELELAQEEIGEHTHQWPRLGSPPVGQAHRPGGWAPESKLPASAAWSGAGSKAGKGSVEQSRGRLINCARLRVSHECECQRIQRISMLGGAAEERMWQRHTEQL